MSGLPSVLGRLLAALHVERLGKPKETASVLQITRESEDPLSHTVRGWNVQRFCPILRGWHNDLRGATEVIMPDDGCRPVTGQ
jgi:hypothetical protein